MRRKILVAISVFIIFIGAYFVFKPKDSQISMLRIGVLKHESSLPIYIADEFGLFKAHNVRIEIVEIPPGDHMPALISKRVDIISATSFPVLFGVMQQHPGLIYAVFPGAEVLNGPTVYGLITRNDFQGNSIKEINGGIVMAINPYTQINIRTILTSAKIPLEKWPEIRVASREASLQAVSDGTAQAAIMDQPALAIALSSGRYRLLEANPRARYIGSPYWSGAGAVLQEQWKQRRSDYMRLMEAVDESIDRIKLDPENAHRVLARRLGINENDASQMGGYYFPKYGEPVPLEGINATIEALVDAKLLTAAITLVQFFPPGLYGH